MRFLKDFWKIIKQTLRDDAAAFRFSVGIKMLAIVIITLGLCLTMTFLFLKINLLFFESNGFPKMGILAEAFYDRAFSSLGNYAIPLGLFLIVNFFIGIYIAELMLRPFQIVAKYCENKVEGKPASYDPGFFSDLRLLTGYCDLFFNLAESAEINKKFVPMIVPERFKSVHRPVFERSFFLHYSSFILITAICTVFALHGVFSEVYENIISMAVGFLTQKQELEAFFSDQFSIFSWIIYVVLCTHFMLSILLTFNLYSKVSAPAFAIFSTFRTFTKGNYNARVHLIGSYFLRPECRIINKYLDDLQKRLT